MARPAATDSSLVGAELFDPTVAPGGTFGADFGFTAYPAELPAPSITEGWPNAGAELYIDGDYALEGSFNWGAELRTPAAYDEGHVNHGAEFFTGPGPIEGHDNHDAELPTPFRIEGLYVRRAEIAPLPWRMEGLIMPTISNVTPAGGQLGVLDVLEFDLNMGQAIYPPTVEVTLDDDVAEVAYAAGAFRGKYRVARSAVTATGPGTYHFAVYRAGGWPASPTLDARAVVG